MSGMPEASVHKGTYNKADPTHFEKGDAEIGIEHGFTAIEEDSCPPWPEPENVSVHWHDCTWGIRFTFGTSIGQEDGYWARPICGCNGEWNNCSEKFEEVFTRLLLFGQPKDFWIAEECADLMGQHYI
jgi:hypothetical protein